MISRRRKTTRDLDFILIVQGKYIKMMSHHEGQLEVKSIIQDGGRFEYCSSKGCISL